MFQTGIAVVERDAAIETFADLDFGAREAEAARLWRDLQSPSVPLHHVVVADDALVREAADALEMFRSRAPSFSRLAREASEAAVVVGAEVAQDTIGRIQIGRAREAQFAAQTILQHTPEAFDAPFRLWGLRGDEGNPQLLQSAAELRGLPLASEFLFERPEVVMADEDATAVSIEGRGHTETAEEVLQEVEIALGGFRGVELSRENFTAGIVLHAQSREARAAAFEPVVR